jgi:hypothetical protein
VASEPQAQAGVVGQRRHDQRHRGVWQLRPRRGLDGPRTAAVAGVRAALLLALLRTRP